MPYSILLLQYINNSKKLETDKNSIRSFAKKKNMHYVQFPFNDI